MRDNSADEMRMERPRHRSSPLSLPERQPIHPLPRSFYFGFLAFFEPRAHDGAQDGARQAHGGTQCWARGHADRASKGQAGAIGAWTACEDGGAGVAVGASSERVHA